MSSSPAPSSQADATNGVRASGRVRKQPETLYNSSPAPGSNKRKRQENGEDVGDDGDVQMPEDYVSDEDLPESDDEPDEEELREQKAKSRKAKITNTKKPAAKKPRANGATTLPIRGSKKHAPKKAKQLDTLDAEEAGGLFAKVFAHNEDLQKIATEWRLVFQDNEAEGVAQVVNFVLKAAGCNSKVSEHDVEDPDAVTSRITDLMEEYQASNPTDYPLMAKGKFATTVKHGVTGFLDVLIKSIAADNVLYTQPELIENLQVWFSTMSTAANRPFRHTATVVSLGILTSLCGVASDTTEKAAKDRRQADGERQKKNVNKERVKAMDAKAKEAGKVQEFVEALLKDWFDTVFVHRYRDIDAAIRRECVEALGDWVVTVPGVFLDGSHLRYMGWLLSDTSAPTRLEVLKQLIRLYKLRDMVGGLKNFTDRFRSRMVEIATSDAESNVRALGVDLLDLLREYGLLEPDDIDAVGRLVFDADPKVRKTVSAFLSATIHETYTAKLDDLGGLQGLEESLPEVSDDSYDAPRAAWLKFKCLAEMLCIYDNEQALPSQIERGHGESGLVLHAVGAENRFSQAAEALYDCMKEIQDWQTLAGYLMFEAGVDAPNGASGDTLAQFKGEAILTEQEHIALLAVLNSAAMRDLVDTAEKISSTKTKLTKKQKGDLQDELDDSATALASLLPRLLKKYGDAPDAAAAVLRIAAIFASPALHALQQDSVTLTGLLEDIGKQFMSHGSDNVLAAASNAILHAKTHGELDELTDEKIQSLWTDVIRNFSEILPPTMSAKDRKHPPRGLSALHSNLLRILHLSQVSDCAVPLELTDDDAGEASAADSAASATIDSIIALIRHGVPGQSAASADSAPMDKIALLAAQSALFFFQWKVKTLSPTMTSLGAPEPTYEELEALATRRDNISDALKDVLGSRKPGEEICAAAAGHMLDLYAAALSLRSLKPRPGASDDYTVLCMELDTTAEALILRVFAAAEKNYAKLSGRKLEDPAETESEDVDDPMSDPESDSEDEDGNTQTQSQGPSQQKREAKLLATLLAEERLCALTGRLVIAVLGGTISVDARTRIERNKAKLGRNFAAVCEYLEEGRVEGKPKGGKKTKAGGVGRAKAAPKSKKSAKSNAIVAEDEVEDEIEDGEEEGI
ncbi:cohesin complex subunit [Oleoguttula sp. CCFEE 5521]